MNCPSFLTSLHEYVEDSLAPERRRAMDKHLEGCADCQRLLQQEQSATNLLTRKLRQGVQHLNLPLDFQKRLRAKLEQEAATPVISIMEARKPNWLELLWPVAIAAGVLLMSFQSVRLFSNPPHAESARVEVMAASGPEISIQYSFRVPTWKFRREGGQVVDTVSYETVVANETLPANNLTAQNLNQEIKNQYED